MYSTIENRTDKEVGFIFPQASCLSQIDAHKLEYNEFPTFTPKLIFELQKKAKITDVLSQAAISAHGFLIGERFKNLLEKFNLMEHRFFPVTIQAKKENNHSYWMHLANINMTNCIDFKASKFYRTEYGYREEDLILLSFNDCKIKKMEYGKMRTTQSDFLKLNDKFNKTIDCFVLPFFSKYKYISEKLANTIEAENISGIEIKEASMIVS